MRKKNLMHRVAPGLVAVATSIMTGAGAGVVLARKPLVVRTDQRRR